MKLLTITVPCYNSEDYIEQCINSLVVGGNEVEVLIVDDGSTDRTGEIAENYAKQYPDIVRVIHQENAGHGGAVNTGIRNAAGMYFKVVDSDDKVKKSAFMEILATLRGRTDVDNRLDMLISNFVYNKVGENKHKVMQYRRVLPIGKVFSWRNAGKFHRGKYILMHSVIFRTQMLRDCRLELPRHTFYVDNIYVFEPLPFVKKMMYLDVNFYYYFIGRKDQSVNEDVMISRLDQQMRVNRIMIDYFTDRDVRRRISAHPELNHYMYNYLEIITTISSILAILSQKPEHLQMKKELWEYLKSRDFMLYMKMRHGLLGSAMNLPGKPGRLIEVGGYKVMRHFYNFN